MMFRTKSVARAAFPLALCLAQAAAFSVPHLGGLRLANRVSLLPRTSPRGSVRISAGRIRLSAAVEDAAITAAKTFLDGNGFYSPLQKGLFADDFVFRAPVIGPLCKVESQILNPGHQNP